MYKFGTTDISYFHFLQISIFANEGHLKFENQTVPSNSDFYHDKSRRELSGAICANMTVK